MFNSDDKEIRRSPIAGTWYPGSERGLARTVEGFLSGVDQPQIDGELLALIVPHAGYSYSGQTAASAYKQLDRMEFDTVVILGPSHRAWLDDFAVSTEDAYETPLGVVELDKKFITHLSDLVPLQRTSRDAEHSLEIQLPFLQVQLTSFRLVPILMSADSPAKAERLAGALAESVARTSAQDGRVLLVASSDLHHIDSYDEVLRRDQPVVEAIGAYDLERLAGLFVQPDCSVCGRIPILAVLHAAKLLGADSVKVLHHTNSGDVTGQRRAGQYTVGYVSAAIYRTT
jgi:AmmeMemoRadiSam system protein B